MATIESLANETLLQILGELKPDRTGPGRSDNWGRQPGRYDALQAAALVCRRWRDPAQQALFQEVELAVHLRLRAEHFLACPARLRHHTSLKILHLRTFHNLNEVKLGPALSDIGTHLHTLVVESDPHGILDICLDIFAIFKSLRSFSWNGLGRFHRLTADHTADLGTILDAFPSPATLTHLSIGTDDFSSLHHVTPLLSHPTLGLLTKLDLPSLPSPTPAEEASVVAALAKACEEHGIQWSMGGILTVS
ncbi:hypothetical protein RQP46_009678 [Phenoliferia psychrophenolica]